MRALFVDPAAQTVTEGDVKGDLKSLQAAVGGYIEGIYPANFDARFGNTLGYVDEEGLFKADNNTRPWSLLGYHHLVGPAVFLDSDSSGNTVACTAPLELLRNLVRWNSALR